MAIQADGYTFALSDEVTRTPVRYRNRYGIEIAADLYQRKDLDESLTYPAIVIGPCSRPTRRTGTAPHPTGSWSTSPSTRPTPTTTSCTG